MFDRLSQTKLQCLDDFAQIYKYDSKSPAAKSKSYQITVVDTQRAWLIPFSLRKNYSNLFPKP